MGFNPFGIRGMDNVNHGSGTHRSLIGNNCIICLKLTLMDLPSTLHSSKSGENIGVNRQIYGLQSSSEKNQPRKT